MTSNRASLDPGTTGETEDSARLLDDMLQKVSAASTDLNDMMILDEDDGNGLSMGDTTNNADDPMDEDDPLDSVDKQTILKSLKSLSRKELEELVLEKAVEVVVKHSQAGKLWTKVLQIQTQKDQMFQRIGLIRQQLQAMEKAMKILLDNQSRDPNSNRIKAPPLRFYRSVGVQVVIQKDFTTQPAKVIPTNEAAVNGVNTVSGDNITKNITPQKRQSNEALNGVNTPNDKVVGIINGQGGPNLQSPATNGNGQEFKEVQKVTTSTRTSPTKTVTNNALSSTGIDLTDDSTEILQTSQDVITPVNKMQHRILNPPSQDDKIFKVPANKTCRSLASRSFQVRPILLARKKAGEQGTSTQARSVRNVAPKPRTAVLPMQTRAMTSRTKHTTVAAKIETIVRAQPIPPRKVKLPDLPLGASPAPISESPKIQELPPRPSLAVRENDEGIVVSWRFQKGTEASTSSIVFYQIYACVESLVLSPGAITSWMKIGDVQAMKLPMASTLSKFTQGDRYYFIVRAVDSHGQMGPFSQPASIVTQKPSNLQVSNLPA